MSIIDKVKAKVVSLKKVSDGTLAWLEEIKEQESNEVEIVEIRSTGSFSNEDLEIHLKYRYKNRGTGYRGLKLIHPLKEYFRGNVEAEPLRLTKLIYRQISLWNTSMRDGELKTFCVSLNKQPTLEAYLKSLG